MNATSVLRVQLKKLHPDAIIPKFQTEGAAGFDLHARLDAPLVIPPQTSVKVSTGIAVSICNPEWGLFLFSRSGLGSKGVRLGNGVGVIDSDYQGELVVILRNDMPALAATDWPFGPRKHDFVVEPGMRIAQGVFMPVRQAEFIEVAEFSVETARGTSGFGSTGLGLPEIAFPDSGDLRTVAEIDQHIKLANGAS